MMKSILLYICLVVFTFGNGFCCEYGNVTLQPVHKQLCEFKMEHPRPIGVLTTTAGRPVDLRETITLNSDLASQEFLLDNMMHLTRERIPARVVHAKGTAAFGYFEVTHDISKYTKADVFNGIGKRTPLVGRFSTATQGQGGPDVSRELKGLAMKLYTKEGNLDILCLQTPVYLYTDPLFFQPQVRSFRRNPSTNVFDRNSQWDFITNRPMLLHAFLYTQSDFGIPLSYRHMNVFPIHTYELVNKEGERFYARFNFRTDQGIRNLTLAQLPNATIDVDYYSRDLYNAIHKKRYPSWTLELDLMTFNDIRHINFNPFDVTRLWKRGSYFTVKVGKVVFNRNPDNQFQAGEVSIFNPANLVPGIPGPVDTLFKGRRIFYRDTQNYRVGVNHNNADVNMPLYAKTYTRDGAVPVRDNMRNAPNYFPNTYNGPEAIVDASLPSKKLEVFESNAIDFEPMNDFYNHVLTDDAQRQRLATALAESLAVVTYRTQRTAVRLLTIIDKDLGRRVRAAIKVATANNLARQQQAERNEYQ